jgi:endonuclease YncB( thermonuclease family)
VAPPLPGACFESESVTRLAGLIGERVIVEPDSAVRGGSTTLGYVWRLNEDGTRELINVLLIEEGLASAEQIPVDARFGAWLRASQTAAEVAAVGLWGACANVASSAETQ